MHPNNVDTLLLKFCTLLAELADVDQRSAHPATGAVKPMIVSHRAARNDAMKTMDLGVYTCTNRCSVECIKYGDARY